jgi:hypothetical protein
LHNPYSCSIPVLWPVQYEGRLEKGGISMQYTVRFFGVLAMNLGIASGEAVILELPENPAYGDVLDGIRGKFADSLPAAMWDEEARCLHRGILAFGSDGKFLARNRDLPLPVGGEVRFHLPLSGG